MQNRVQIYHFRVRVKKICEADANCFKFKDFVFHFSTKDQKSLTKIQSEEKDEFREDPLKSIQSKYDYFAWKEIASS